MLPIQLQFLIPALFGLLCLVVLVGALRNGKPAAKRGPAKGRRRERRLRQRRVLHDRRKAVRGMSRRKLAGRRGEDQWSDIQSRY